MHKSQLPDFLGPKFLQRDTFPAHHLALPAFHPPLFSQEYLHSIADSPWKIFSDILSICLRRTSMFLPMLLPTQSKLMIFGRHQRVLVHLGIVLYSTILHICAQLGHLGLYRVYVVSQLLPRFLLYLGSGKKAGGAAKSDRCSPHSDARLKRRGRTLQGGKYFIPICDKCYKWLISKIFSSLNMHNCVCLKRSRKRPLRGALRSRLPLPSLPYFTFKVSPGESHYLGLKAKYKINSTTHCTWTKPQGKARKYLSRPSRRSLLCFA